MIRRPIVIVLTPFLILAARLMTAIFIFHQPVSAVSFQMAASHPVRASLDGAACRVAPDLAG